MSELIIDNRIKIELKKLFELEKSNLIDKAIDKYGIIKHDYHTGEYGQTLADLSDVCNEDECYNYIYDIFIENCKDGSYDMSDKAYDFCHEHEAEAFNIIWSK